MDKGLSRILLPSNSDAHGLAMIANGGAAVLPVCCVDRGSRGDSRHPSVSHKVHKVPSACTVAFPHSADVHQRPGRPRSGRPVPVVVNLTAAAHSASIRMQQQSDRALLLCLLGAPGRYAGQNREGPEPSF